MNEIPQFHGSGANQEYLQSMSGQPFQERHDLEHIAEGAIWFVIWTYIIGWFAKKAWHRPMAFVVLILSITMVVVISDIEQHFFWPVWIPLTIGLIALGRMVRR
jgi:hypothetical protein